MLIQLAEARVERRHGFLERLELGGHLVHLQPDSGQRHGDGLALFPQALFQPGDGRAGLVHGVGLLLVLVRQLGNLLFEGVLHRTHFVLEKGHLPLQLHVLLLLAETEAGGGKKYE